MKLDWSPINAELGQWRRAGLSLPIWWRDDDAVAATPALEQMIAMSAQIGMPVHVAVIPDRIELSLAPAIAAHTGVIPIVHGWQHVSHAAAGAKNAEFGHPRAEAAQELKAGLTALTQTFGDDLVPLFVPPWNRIDDSLLPVLREVGYGGVSTYGARQMAEPVTGLMQINTHIDPIFWRGHRGLVDPDTLVAGITRTLMDRRSGKVDVQEPLGLLTHHLVHTDEVWRFTRDLLVVMLEGGAVPADVAKLLQTARTPEI